MEVGVGLTVAMDTFGCTHLPQPGLRGKKKAHLVTRIHCWAYIERTLKHLWACIPGNAQIDHFSSAKPARCNPRHVGVGSCTHECGCGPEKSLFPNTSS